MLGGGGGLSTAPNTPTAPVGPKGDMAACGKLSVPLKTAVCHIPRTPFTYFSFKPTCFVNFYLDLVLKETFNPCCKWETSIKGEACAGGALPISPPTDQIPAASTCRLPVGLPTCGRQKSWERTLQGSPSTKIAGAGACNPQLPHPHG